MTSFIEHSSAYGGKIAILTFNHPPANTWNLAALNAFEEAIDTVQKDGDIRVLVLTGSGGKCFSAGFDVTDAANSPIISPKARHLWRRIDRMSIPTIAAINGHALGGGLELALCCHFRIAVRDPNVQLGLTELNLGIIPGWGGTQRLPRAVGRALALEMILFSKRVSPEGALAIGLVNQLSDRDRFMEDVISFAQELADRPPIAVRWVLDAMAAGMYEGLDRGLDVEADGAAAVRQTQDREEGFRAFLEKRKPVFQGR